MATTQRSVGDFGSSVGGLSTVQQQRMAEQSKRTSNAGRKRVRVLSAPSFDETSNVWTIYKPPGEYSVIGMMPIVKVGDRIDVDGSTYNVTSVVGKTVIVRGE